MGKTKKFGVGVAGAALLACSVVGLQVATGSSGGDRAQADHHNCC